VKQSNSKKAKTHYPTDPKLRLLKKDRSKTVFIYARISREYNLESESNRIQSRIQLLTQLAEGYGHMIMVIF